MATEASEKAADSAPGNPQIAFPRKTLYWIGGITIAIWAFAISTGSTIFMGILGGLTLALAFVLFRAFRFIKRQRGIVSTLQGAGQSPEARRQALAKLEAGKDVNDPTNVFARAQLIAADDPNAALKLLDTVPLNKYPPGMQDDVSLLRTQLYLANGRTADARKAADTINLDNPDRKQARPLAGVDRRRSVGAHGQAEGSADADRVDRGARERRRADRDSSARRKGLRAIRGEPAWPRAQRAQLARRRGRQPPRPLPRSALQGPPRAAEARAPGPREEPRRPALDESPSAKTLMGALDQPEFERLVNAGCTACGHATLEISSFIDRSIVVMVGDPNNDGRWVHDGEKFVDGTYKMACASCAHTVFASDVCPRCNAQAALSSRAHERAGSPFRNGARSATSSSCSRSPSFLRKRQSEAAPKPQAIAEYGEPGYHIVAYACHECDNAVVAEGCPLCDAPGPLRKRP